MPKVLMKYCPVTGKLYPEPRNPDWVRNTHQPIVWWFNPWTGTKRNELDVKSDPHGELIVLTDDVVLAATNTKKPAGHQHGAKHLVDTANKSREFTGRRTIGGRFV